MWNSDLSGCQIWCVRSRIIEFDISRNDNLDIRDSVPLKYVSHREPSKKITQWENILVELMMLGIGKTTFKSLQALHSALFTQFLDFFDFARRVI